jgi:DNA-binding phage protein
VKIRGVRANNRTRCFEADTPRGLLTLPYARVSPSPSRADRVTRVSVDPELGREAFTYELASGREGSVHADALLEEHEDPAYMVDLLIHQLTIEARRRMDETHLSAREVCRRLGTSATQLYRLLDERNGNASLRQLMVLLRVLGCGVELRLADAAARKNGRRVRRSVRARAR